MTPLRTVVRSAATRLLAALLCVGLGAPVSAGAAVVGDLIVVADDGTILEPAAPVPLSGRRLVLVPRGNGYETRVEEGVVPAALGAQIPLSEAPDEPVHLPLVRPVPMFGQLHSDLYVHPQGALSFGAPLADGAAVRSERPAELFDALLTDAPVLAVLWNDLRPAEGTAPGAGLYFAELPDRVVVTWVKVPSNRPAGLPNTFRAVLHRSGRVELEYPRLATRWGMVGLSPGATRVSTDVVDFVDGPKIDPGRAVFSWYRDRARLNEVALARQIYAEAPDQFDFLAVFTDRVVDGEHMVGSVTVANEVRGIGMPVFDHGAAFGSRNLEHMILMNSLSLYDDNPRNPPRIPGHAFAPSTLAVLGHEMGHRWLAHGGEPLVANGKRGHWNFFLHTDGSFMGGSRLIDNADGTFTTDDVMTRFGPLDQYLMGVRTADEVDDFFVVEEARDVERQASAAPASGVTFGGARRDVSVGDVIDLLGERTPAADGSKVFRMGFVLVTARGEVAAPTDLAKLERIRRSYGPYFRAATEGRARVWSRMARPRGETAVVEAEPLPPEPFILDVGFRPGDDGSTLASVDFLDFNGDVVRLELSTDATEGLPPARIDLSPSAFGSRRGTVSFGLRYVPPGATEVRLALVDSSGLRSELFAAPLPAASSET